MGVQKMQPYLNYLNSSPFIKRLVCEGKDQLVPIVVKYKDSSIWTFEMHLELTILQHNILELPKLDRWEFGANLSQTLLVAVFNKNLKL